MPKSKGISIVSVFIFCGVVVCLIQKVFTCDKGIFNEIKGKRGRGAFLLEVNVTSVNHCLRACRLMRKCYRFNFGGKDIENGLCQLLIQYNGLTDDTRWSYYVTCPDDMDYYESTGSCYGLASHGSNFNTGSRICETWAPGVHLADIYSDAENAICGSYFGETGNHGSFIGARRPEGNNESDSFYWITTQDSLSYTRWRNGQPTVYTSRQCVVISVSNNIIGWKNMPCGFSYKALCKM